MSSSTVFLSASKNRIMRGTRGGFYIVTGGKKVYGLKAMFRKVGSNGRTTKIGNHGTVHASIRRKRMRNVRPTNLSNSTCYLDVNRRRIMHGANGGFYSNSSMGKKTYGLKARFRKVGSGGRVTKIATPNAVPVPIRS